MFVRLWTFGVGTVSRVNCRFTITNRLAACLIHRGIHRRPGPYSLKNVHDICAPPGSCRLWGIKDVRGGALPAHSRASDDTFLVLLKYLHATAFLGAREGGRVILGAEALFDGWARQPCPRYGAPNHTSQPQGTAHNLAEAQAHRNLYTVKHDTNVNNKQCIACDEQENQLHLCECDVMWEEDPGSL
jgi:hypothetical protein